MKIKTKFAVIGCGHIGKRHAAVIANNAECELVALCDTAGKKSLELEDNNIPFYTSVEELLSSGPPMNVVCIATPNGLHEEQALKVLEAGYHVLIEKPMALTSTGCERIIKESIRHQKQVFCVMQNRYAPPAAWLKKIITQKILGDIYIVQVNCFWNRDERYYTRTDWHGTKDLDGGTLFTQFSHFVDSIYWLFGDINNISARFGNYDHKGSIDFEDSGFVHFDLVNGGTGSLNYSTAVWKENLESSMIIIGENGTVKIGGQYLDTVEYCNIKNYTMPVLCQSIANHHYVLENLVKVLKGECPQTTNAEDGLKVVGMIERIYAAGATPYAE